MAYSVVGTDIQIVAAALTTGRPFSLSTSWPGGIIDGDIIITQGVISSSAPAGYTKIAPPPFYPSTDYWHTYVTGDVAPSISGLTGGSDFAYGGIIVIRPDTSFTHIIEVTSDYICSLGGCTSFTAPQDIVLGSIDPLTYPGITYDVGSALFGIEIAQGGALGGQGGVPAPPSFAAPYTAFSASSGTSLFDVFNSNFEEDSVANGVTVAPLTTVTWTVDGSMQIDGVAVLQSIRFYGTGAQYGWGVLTG